MTKRQPGYEQRATDREAKRERVLDLLEQTLDSIGVVSKSVGVVQSTVYRWGEKVLGYKFMCERAVKRSEANRTKTYADGYSRTLTPKWYTGRRHGRVVRTHHIVWCWFNGASKVPDGYDVHHIDGDKLNNAPSNLELMTHAEHTRLHRTKS